MSMVIVGEDINKFRLLAIKSAMDLERAGLKSRGRSAHSVAAQILGIKAKREAVYEAYCTYLVEIGLIGKGKVPPNRGQAVGYVS